MSLVIKEFIWLFVYQTDWVLQRKIVILFTMKPAGPHVGLRLSGLISGIY